MTQHQIDRKYAKCLVVSTILLVVACICIAVVIAGLATDNSTMVLVGGCVGLPTLIIGFVYTVLSRHDYLEGSDAAN